MHKKFLLASLLFSSVLFAENWQVKNIYFQTENDADIRNDTAYSYGAKIGALFLRDEVKDSRGDKYISFSFAHELYTPKDLTRSDVIVGDRPYAGYMYLQGALHQVKENSLLSLSTQVGVVGPSSQMEGIQKVIHDLISSPYPQGWDNQIKDEFIFQVNFSQKKYYDLEHIYGYSASLVPSYGVELGNASTKAYGSALFRWGKNVPKDFGTYIVNNSDTSKIPISAKEKDNKKWRYYINFSLQANAIARNIFLDGNSFRESHSVEKYPFTLDVGYGLSFAYKAFSIDYLRRHTSKEYTTQEELYSYGSLLFSYHY